MFHKKIDKLQSDIDEMLDLCEKADNTSENAYEELGILILRAQDGELDRQGYKKLEKQLTENDLSLGYYVDFQLLSALLHEENDNHRIHRMMNIILENSAVHSM